MRFPLVLDLAADGIAVAVTSRILGFSQQAFYQWKANPVTDRDWDDAHLIDAAIAIHAEDPVFGYRFLADELPGHGIIAGENRVHRLCSAQRLVSVHATKRGLNRRPGPPVHDDLVERDFTAGGTEPVVAHRFDRTPHRRGQALLVRDQRRLLQPDRGLLHRLPHEGVLGGHCPARRGGPPRHGGWLRGPQRPVEITQFASIRYGERLAEIDAMPSIGTVGDSYDNALAETVNGYYKAELIRGPAREGRPWKTFEDVEFATLSWVHWHNHDRVHSSIGQLPPIEFEHAHRAGHNHDLRTGGRVNNHPPENPGRFSSFDGR